MGISRDILGFVSWGVVIHHEWASRFLPGIENGQPSRLFSENIPCLDHGTQWHAFITQHQWHARNPEDCCWLCFGFDPCLSKIETMPQGRCGKPQLYMWNSLFQPFPRLLGELQMINPKSWNGSLKMRGKKRAANIATLIGKRNVIHIWRFPFRHGGTPI